MDKTSALKTRLSAVSNVSAAMQQASGPTGDFGDEDGGPTDSDVATPMKALELAVSCYVAALESEHDVEAPDPVALAERMWKFLWDESA